MQDLTNYNFYSGEESVDSSHYLNGNRTSETSFNVPKHPLYEFLFSQWVQLGDCVYGGEYVIKLKGEDYLRKTHGQTKSKNGVESYEAYKSRACYFNYPAKVAKTMVGLMTRKNDFFSLPKAIESLVNKAGYNGESLQETGRQVKECVAVYGRAGLLAYVEDKNKEIRFKKYNSFDIRDWIFMDGELRAVLLDESDYRPEKGFVQNIDPRFLVVGLDSEGYYYQILITDEKDLEKLKTFDHNTPSKSFKNVVYPVFNSKKSSEIPFQFFNPSDNSHIPGASPLMNLCNMSLGLYRQDADYKQALFMQGQGTPIFTGFRPDEIKGTLLGAEGGIIAEDPEATAAFMELSGNGLTEMKEACKHQHGYCVDEGLSLVVTSSEPESNAALMTRMDSKTAGIAEIVEAYEVGLKKLIEIVLKWGGITDEYEIKCNRDFMRSEDIGQEIVNLMAAWTKGAPFSEEDLHDWCVKNDLTSRTLEDIKASNAKNGIMPMGEFSMMQMTNSFNKDDKSNKPEDPEGKGSSEDNRAK